VKVVLVGMSHRTAPVAIRERFTLTLERSTGMTEKLARHPEVIEAAILATCNRTELVAIADEEGHGIERLCHFMEIEVGEGPLHPRHLYRLREEEAILHLFRVTSALDSMVLGEAQILGQVKAAYRAAVEARSCGPVLNRLFQHAFRAAKRVRTETGLGASSVSVARVGVRLARELFESFEGKQVLLLGAGEMAESALLGLQEAGVESVVVANRTLAAAERLAARVRGRPVPLDELETELASTDVLISSVQVATPLVGRDLFDRVLARRHGRPLLAIDLGLPRNIDPEANKVENLYVYDLDDLQGIAEDGLERRREAVVLAEAILLEEATRFDGWRETIPLVPTIQQLIDDLEGVARAEVQQTLKGLDAHDPSTEALLDRLGELIARKILHRPLSRLRSAAHGGTGLYYADAVRRLFGLEDEEGEER
jgi:glutamyl-tRNA reductase